MFIDFTIVDKKDNEFSDLLDKIDKKIAYISNLKLNNIRFGLTTSINYDLYEDLIDYKEILIGKMCGSPCLCDFDINKIKSRIKSLLNQTC